MRKLMHFLIVSMFVFSCPPFFAYASESPFVVQASVGDAYTMILEKDGSLWGVGRNEYGQLGNGTFETQFQPVKVLDQVTFVSAGAAHTMAIQKDGTLWGWGKNAMGALGDGTDENCAKPVKIMTQVASVSAGTTHSIGGAHTLAVKKDGTLWGWGNNWSGQLGANNDHEILTPIQLWDNVKNAISAYNCSYILKTDGTLWVLGDTNYATNTSTFVPLGDGIKEIFVDPFLDQIAYIRTDDSLWVLTTEMIYDESSTGKFFSTLTGKERFHMETIPLKIMDHVTTASYVYPNVAWVNNKGTLFSADLMPTDDASSTDTPHTQIHDMKTVFEGVSSVSLGTVHGVVVKKDGSLWGFGSNADGQLGRKNPNIHTTPQQIIPQTDFVNVFWLGDAPYVLKMDHALWACTYSTENQKLEFQKQMDQVLDLKRSSSFGAVLDTAHTLSFVNADKNGDLDFSTQQKLLDHVLSVDVLSPLIIATTQDGSVWFWNLGEYVYTDKTTSKLPAPIKVADQLNSVVFRNYMSFWGITKDHSLLSYAWDVPFTAAETKSIMPWSEDEKIVSDVASIAVTKEIGMIVKTDGSLWAWGANNYGQLGNGTTKSQQVPVKIMENVKSVALHNNLSLVLKTDGSLWGFGMDDTGIFFAKNESELYEDPIQIKLVVS